MTVSAFICFFTFKYLLKIISESKKKLTPKPKTGINLYIARKGRTEKLMSEQHHSLPSFVCALNEENKMKKILFVICLMISSSVFAQEQIIFANCPDSYVMDEQGKCRPCSELMKFKTLKNADCSQKCRTKDGKYIRKIGRWGCELVACPNGSFDSFGNCQVAKTTTCPSDRPLLDKEGKCHPCDELSRIKLKNKDDCEALCQIDGKSLRHDTFWGCSLKECPPNAQKDNFENCHIFPSKCPATHPLREKNYCFDCAYEGVVDLDEKNVHLCSQMCQDSQGNPTRQLFQNAGCGLITCPTDKPLRSNGSCVSCDSETSYPTNKCDICPQRTIVNFDNQEWCALKTCPTDKPLRGLYGDCYSCDDDEEVYVEQQVCLSSCPNRQVEKVDLSDIGIYDKSVQSIEACLLKKSKKTSKNIDFSSMSRNRTVLKPKFETSHCPEDKPLMDYNGECYACDDPGLITLELEDLCSKCPNRVYTDLFHYTEEGVSYRYICKIAEEKDIRLRREGNSFYYYDQNNQLVEEKHLLSDNPESDTLYKYYKNGVLWRVQYQLNYRRNGIEQRYDANGKLESEIPYKNNKMDGIVKNFFPDGKIKSEIPYQNNKKSGLGKWYHPNGVLSSTGYYKNDVFEGEYKLFNQQGEVIEVGVYKNGKIINRQKLK